MQTNDPKSVNHCLQANSLKFIVQKANQITTLDKILYDILPRDIAPHCQVMNITKQTLILQADSAVWATRVRYLIPNLIETLTEQKFEIAFIQCRVRP